MRAGIKMVGLAAAAAGLWMAAGCGDGGYGESLVDRFDYGDKIGWDTEGAAQLALSDSCDEASAALHDAAIVGMLMDLEQQRRAAIDDYRDRDTFFDVLFGGGVMGGGGVAISSDIEAPAGAPRGSGASGRTFTDTNVQTAGVDEADVVETDGELLYTLSGDALVIVDAWPAAQMAELGRVALPGHPEAMYLYGERVLVLSRGTPTYGWERDGWSSGDRANDRPRVGVEGMTLATLVDVSDPTAPAVLARWGFEGDTSATRRVGGKVYLVQGTALQVEGLQSWVDVNYDDDEDAITRRYVAAARANIAALEAADLDTLLPRVYDVSPAGVAARDTARVLTDCAEVYRPGVYSGRGVLTVVTLDLDAPDAPPFAASIVGGWGTVYASAEALYVATSDWAFGWWWGGTGGRDFSTQIHKFSFEPTTGEAIYAASGSVRGHAVGQFALDEREGLLRVATTAADDHGTESFVTVLEEQRGELAQIGQVGGIGAGEDIYAVRFIEDRGYVVTFRQVDPLHVIDLSDPRHPAVAGTLEIPGYSSYLHPLGDGYLLAIGRDGDESGATGGLQLSIFDVTDATAPRRIHTITHTDAWGSWSAAESDHHAFTYYAERGLLAIPVGSWREYDGTVGLSLFGVDVEAGFEPLGTIHHDGLVGSEVACGEQATSIRRGVFIEDVIYSVSEAGVEAHSAANLAAGPLSTVRLLNAGDNYCASAW